MDHHGELLVSVGNCWDGKRLLVSVGMYVDDQEELLTPVRCIGTCRDNDSELLAPVRNRWNQESCWCLLSVVWGSNRVLGTFWKTVGS